MDTSKTSMNIRPSLYNLVKKHTNGWKNVNLDYGAGRYHSMKNLLDKEKNTICIEYDKFNKKECPLTLSDIKNKSPFYSVSLSNVLNVCQTSTERLTILRNIKSFKPKYIYISIHEGNDSNIGAKTRNGWQENRGTKTYIDEIKKIFTNVKQFGKLILVTL